MPGVPPGAMAHWMADHSWAASAYPSNYVIGTYIILFYTWYFPTSEPKITFFFGGVVAHLCRLIETSIYVQLQSTEHN